MVTYGLPVVYMLNINMINNNENRLSFTWKKGIHGTRIIIDIHINEFPMSKDYFDNTWCFLFTKINAVQYSSIYLYRYSNIYTYGFVLG